MTKTRDLTLESKLCESVYHILFVLSQCRECVFFLPKEFTKISICVLLTLWKSGFFQKQGFTHLAAIHKNRAINSSSPHVAVFFGF